MKDVMRLIMSGSETLACRAVEKELRDGWSMLLRAWLLVDRAVGLGDRRALLSKVHNLPLLPL